MSRKNWAELYSNQETCVFEKGSWKLTKDGEGTLSLYFDENFVDTAFDYNKYKLLNNGFILYRESADETSYRLYSSSNRKPLLSAHGKNAKFEVVSNILFCYDEDGIHIYDADLLTPIVIQEDNQIPLNI